MSNIVTEILPALRQSSVETMACPRSYVEVHINGHDTPDSIASTRGTEIHHVMSQYINHCSSLKISSDWNYFDQLTRAAGPVAGPILDGMRNSYEVDWNRSFATEVVLALDEELRPAYKVIDADTGKVTEIKRHPGVTYSEELAAHIGTLDHILVNEEIVRGKIEDFKSHPSPFEADTYQAYLYALMLLLHIPTLQDVTFELIFVRYTNCARRDMWRRADIAELSAHVRRARERQRDIHAHPDMAEAIPSKICVYCPLAKNFTCPIAEWNEYTTLSPADRLRWKIWMSKMNELNNPVLKTFAEVHGSVSYQDGNGKTYEYAEQAVPSTRYPLDDATLEVLNDYTAATGEDWRNWKLSISSTGIKPKLNTKKRADLREIFEDSLIERSTKPKFAVRTPEGIEQDFNPYAEE